MAPEELKRLRELADAATEGPWGWDKDWKRLRALKPLEPGALIESIIWPDNSLGHPQKWSDALGSCGLRAEPDAEANAIFIAAARAAVPALLDEVARLQAVALTFEDEADAAGAEVARLQDEVRRLRALMKADPA